MGAVVSHQTSSIFCHEHIDGHLSVFLVGLLVAVMRSQFFHDVSNDVRMSVMRGPMEDVISKRIRDLQVDAICLTQ